MFRYDFPHAGCSMRSDTRSEGAVHGHDHSLAAPAITHPGNPASTSIAPRVVNGVLELPVYYMRGGTSTGIVLWDAHLPADLALREEAIRWIMGVPPAAKRKATSRPRDSDAASPPATRFSSSTARRMQRPTSPARSRSSQPTKSAIDWSVNCGNMSAALPMYALDTGLFPATRGKTVLRIYNTNTKVTTDATVKTPEGTPFIPADAEIPRRHGPLSGVELSLRNPVGAKTGKLLPTGNVVDRFAGVEASCVDVAVPMVIVRAADVGMTGHESVEALAREYCAEGQAARDLGRSGTQDGAQEEGRHAVDRRRVR